MAQSGLWFADMPLGNFSLIHCHFSLNSFGGHNSVQT